MYQAIPRESPTMGVGSHVPGAYGLANLAKPHQQQQQQQPKSAITSLPTTAGLADGGRQYGMIQKSPPPNDNNHAALNRLPNFASTVSDSSTDRQYLALPSTVPRNWFSSPRKKKKKSKKNSNTFMICEILFLLASFIFSTLNAESCIIIANSTADGFGNSTFVVQPNLLAVGIPSMFSKRTLRLSLYFATSYIVAESFIVGIKTNISSTSFNSS